MFLQTRLRRSKLKQVHASVQYVCLFAHQAGLTPFEADLVFAVRLLAVVVLSRDPRESLMNRQLESLLA